MTENKSLEEIKVRELQRWKNLDFETDPEDNYVSNEQIVIIGGCGRSGTTLLRVLLDTHSQIACGPESQLFLPIKVDLNDLSKKFNMNLEILESMQKKSQSKTQFIEMFLNAYLQLMNKKIWADKTSRNIHRLHYILKHFPNAKIIHMIRNGKDVVSSLKTHRKRMNSAGKLIPTGLVMPLQDCIDRWLLSIKDCMPFCSHKNYMEVRYEMLVLNTKKTLNNICQFIGVEYEQSMMNYYLIDSTSRNPLYFPQNIEATRPISSESIDRWKRDLSEYELEQVKLQIDPSMEKIGYLPNDNSFDIDRAPCLAIPIIDAPIVEKIVDNDMNFIKEYVLKAFQILKTDEAYLTQPAKLYLQRRSATSSSDRIIAMPFYLEGPNAIAGIKWIGGNEANCSFRINRANSILILNNTKTNAPICIMDDGVISSMRTLAISLIAIEIFMPRPKKIACIGIGKLGRMHVAMLSKHFPTVEKIYCFSNTSNFDDLISENVVKCNTWLEAVKEAEVIVTTTSTNEPYIKGDDINGNKLLINLSLMDFDLSVYQKSSLIIVDNWFQCTQAKKVFKRGVDSGIIQRHHVIEFPDLINEQNINKKPVPHGIIMVNALGMAIEDIIVAQAVYNKLMYMSTIKPNYFYMDNRMNPLTDPSISDTMTAYNPYKRVIDNLENEKRMSHDRIQSLEKELKTLKMSAPSQNQALY